MPEPHFHINNHHTSPAAFILIPFAILFFFLFIIAFILYKNEHNPNMKIIFKILFYIAIQFLILPILFIFVLINVPIIIISYFCMKKLYYISGKTLYQWITQLIDKIKCKKSFVNTIKIIKRAEMELPERASKYKDVNDDSKQKENVTDNQLNLNINANVISNLNNPNIQNEQKNQTVNNNAKSLFDTNANYRPKVVNNSSKTKKVMEILSQALVKEDNTPGYIALLNTLKNKAKKKFDDKNNTNSSTNIVL